MTALYPAAMGERGRWLVVSSGGSLAERFRSKRRARGYTRLLHQLGQSAVLRRYHRHDLVVVHDPVLDADLDPRATISSRIWPTSEAAS